MRYSSCTTGREELGKAGFQEQSLADGDFSRIDSFHLGGIRTPLAVRNRGGNGLRGNHVREAGDAHHTRAGTA
jgi:hypothetical protein